jgi:hypothetical protein
MIYTRLEKKTHLLGSPLRRDRHSKLAGYAEFDHAPSYVIGYLQAGDRRIPQVSTSLSAADRLGAIKTRWGIGRDSYKILPGLYASGAPNQDSPLMLSANYKMSFDQLRNSLGPLDAWILVLDTKGINVWCAAGKGSFGTAELLDKIERTNLKEIIRHNRIIAPQLGATGLAAPEIARKSGFRILWGPVRARDIPAFLDAGMVKTAEMRSVSFSLQDRITLAPIELAQAWPLFAVAAALALLAALPPGKDFGSVFLRTFTTLAGAVFAGTVLFPAALPLLPFKAFAAKGAVLGTAWGIASAILGRYSPLMSVASILVCAPLVSFLAMNFTGASTFTCQKGAQLEVEKGIIPMILSIVAGLAAVIISKLSVF